MKAIYYTRFGGPDVLQYGELSEPRLGESEVKIQIAYAGVNPIDWKLRTGAMKAFFPYSFPVIPGWDVAGRVAAVGSKVTGFAVGDAVMSYCRKQTLQWGTYAEYVCVEAAHVTAVPDGMDMVFAGALPLVGLTAWQSVVEAGQVKAGQTAVILAAAGGVGVVAVPLARHLGARVLAACGPDNADFVRALGADEIIDYRTEPTAEAIARLAPDGADMILDAVGGAQLEMLYDQVKPGGVLVGLNDAPDEARCAARGIRGVRLFSSPDGTALAQLAALYADGTLPVFPTEVMPLRQAAQAHKRSAAGHVRGKIVLAIDV